MRGRGRGTPGVGCEHCSVLVTVDTDSVRVLGTLNSTMYRSQINDLYAKTSIQYTIPLAVYNVHSTEQCTTQCKAGNSPLSQI